MKTNIDPIKTRGYNHYRIDGDKPVIPNALFKKIVALANKNNSLAELTIKKYALDSTQKQLLLNCNK